MRLVVLAAAALALAVLAVTPGSAVAGTVTPLGGDDFGVQSGFFSLGLMGTDSLSVYGFGVSDGGAVPEYRPVFDDIAISAFSRGGAPMFQGDTLVVDGAAARLEVHSSPLAALDLRTTSANSVTIDPVYDIGLIARGTTASIGDETLAAELAVLGDGTVEKSGDLAFVDLSAGSRLIFRQAVLGHELGSHIVSGRLAAEAYIGVDSEGATMDSVLYQPITLSLDASSPERKTFTVSGDLGGPRVLALDIAREGFVVGAADLSPTLDGTAYERVASISDVMSHDGLAFVAFESEELLQVFVTIPQFSAHTLVLVGIGPAPVSLTLYVGLAASIGVTVAAAAYLFRPDEY